MNERDFQTIKLGGAMICSENIDLEKWTHDQVETSRYLEVRNERLVQRKELEIWLWIQRRKKTLELRKRRNSLKEMCKEKRTKSPGLGNFLPLFHSSQVHHVLCAVEYEHNSVPLQVTSLEHIFTKIILLFSILSQSPQRLPCSLFSIQEFSLLCHYCHPLPNTLSKSQDGLQAQPDYMVCSHPLAL